ncbi:PAS domain S-box protein [Xanthomonas sp. NCPPB 2654]|uniref:ATP-binding protein n=1 Tax=unclassified Xanthomonas TaxID=2643310 RepID=UPI0021DFC1C6|nr:MULTISPECIES: ATP-binding protein [unclassified Xanthomonas]MDL5364816.1 PAS domain S-box protein [Xanthomonas sp. NCPPB 2654]UYC18841.1 PAS domain S-box protein [Xanthomonas sp. CFBP 8443]
MRIPLATEADRLLLQSVTDYAIYMLDPDGFILSWNTGGRHIKGYEEAEIIGQHFSRFYTPQDAADGLPRRGLDTAKREGRYEAEGWRVRKDGSHFRASVVIDPVWKDGDLVGYAKVTRDVTEKFNAAENLRKAERALAQAQKVQAIGRLTLGIAHDFNNLLAIIVGSLDLLAKSQHDARSKLLIGAATDAAERGSRLSQQMLAFARGQDLVPEPNEVNALIFEGAELYRRVAGESIACEFALAEALPTVVVDASQFEAALMNLVANARDAMPHGRIVISTRLCRSDATQHVEAKPDHDYVCVAVQDDGPGMSEEVRLRAMEPFFTTKDVGSGSGLGLSQVFGFAGQSGGFATIESEEGEGTLVTMYIPVAN